MIRPRRRKRPCPYCGTPTRGAACPLHADLLEQEPNAVAERCVRAEAELQAGELEQIGEAARLPGKQGSGRMRPHPNG